MATICPIACKRSTISCLCSGYTPANPSAPKTKSSTSWYPLPGGGPSFNVVDKNMFSPIPKRRPVSFAIA
ncbi:hypothetical protein BCR42DRAFT_403018, partial [Absidia repens]